MPVQYLKHIDSVTMQVIMATSVDSFTPFIQFVDKRKIIGNWLVNHVL